MGALAAVCLLLLSSCATEDSRDGPAAERIVKVSRSQLALGLYDAHVAVSTFCLYGGVYAAIPTPRNGFYGYNSVDSLGLLHSQGEDLVTYYVDEGEGGWLKVNFGVGGPERYDFFLNPDRRLASCGAEGLRNLREDFRSKGTALPVKEFPSAVSRAKHHSQHWISASDDLSGHSDSVICAMATGRTYGRWDTVYWSAPYAEEAKKRGFTPQSCVALLNDPVLERNADLDRLLADARQQIASHWPNSSSTGMSKDDLLRTFRVAYALEAYTKRLKRLPLAPETAGILSAIQLLFARLDQINAETGNRLLETDEREFLVPLIVTAAEISGLNPTQFPDGDPTAAFRTF
jgi:hypothetical protein